MTEQTLLVETAEGVKNGVGFGGGLSSGQETITAGEKLAAIKERLHGLACNRAD